MHTRPLRRRSDHSHSAASIALGLLTVALLLLADSLQSGERPWHEQLIATLRTHDDVLPPELPVHPVAAMYNREAIVPPQCYTRTEGKHNPCYVCHQNALPKRENTMNDGGLQLAYSFSPLGTINHWENLFEDRRSRAATISEREILEWVERDNYDELAPRLKAAGFAGWIPDLANLGAASAAFDSQGLARDGSQWMAFNYKPLPSTFWPTNGSTDDVMIRLPAAYRSRPDGSYSRDIYIANLAIAEALIKGLDRVDTPPLNEADAGEDIDGDGRLGTVTELRDFSSWVGQARGHFLKSSLYPQGTEFLHTVRYVGVDDHGEIFPSRRMKEVRYMRKAFLLSPDAVAEAYREEGYHKDEGLLPRYTNRGEEGLDNGMGWLLQTFIEDRSGRLRVATFEENVHCMGCHSSVGTTIDKTFSFPRKVDGAAGWGYINLKNMRDAPNRGEAEGEILTYFRRAGGGDEFRSNLEMRAQWFNEDGSVNEERVRAADDVYTLVKPSRQRALDLNRAYRLIVEDQDYLFGRDVTIVPPENVYQRIDDSAPTLPADRYHSWDITLDW
jgi:hypothetical protein